MPLLISFEGIDGSGKSTLIEKVGNYLGNSIITREPRGTELGYKIWEMINDSISKEDLIRGSWTNLFLFLASHSEHVSTVVKPRLEEGKTVIIDRYIDSTFVYQGLNKKLGVKKIQDIMKNTIFTPVPQITFVLDIDPIIAQERLKKRREKTGEYTNFDSMEIKFHQKIRGLFREVKEMFPERIYIIDANRYPDEVFEEVLETLKKKNLK